MTKDNGFVSSGYVRESWERQAYNEAMGKPATSAVPCLYPDDRENHAAWLQWSYRMPGRKPGNGTWKEYLSAFTNGAKAPRKTLPPLERLSKAARARKRANNEWKRAIQAGRDSHTLAELAAAAGVSRQRVSQILSA